MSQNHVKVTMKSNNNNNNNDNNNNNIHPRSDAVRCYRTSQACDYCHGRRIKCQFDSSLGTCFNCRRRLQNCTFHRIPQKRGPHHKRRKSSKLKSSKKTFSPLRDDTDALKLPSTKRMRTHVLKESEGDVLTSDTDISYEYQRVKIGNKRCHLLRCLLECYYREVHIYLSVFPLDTFKQFQDLILDKIKESKLVSLFHLILESVCYEDERGKIKQWRRLWNQLVTMEGIDSIECHVLYMICHFLIFIMIRVDSKVLGHCIGIYYEVCDKLPIDIKVRLKGVTLLMDLLNQKFNSKDAMFSMISDSEGILIPGNIYELIVMLKEDVDLETLRSKTVRTTSMIWLAYCEVNQNRLQFIKSINNDTIDFENVVNKLCCLIRSMLDLLVHVDNDRYTSSLYQILNHRTNNIYKYEFGLKLILNKVRQLSIIIKDTPQFLINFITYSTESERNRIHCYGTTITNTNPLVTRLSDSIDELAQITTLIHRLGEENYGIDNSFNKNDEDNKCIISHHILPLMLYYPRGAACNIQNNNTILGPQTNSVLFENVNYNGSNNNNSSSSSQCRSTLLVPYLRNAHTYTTLANQGTPLDKLYQLSKKLQDTK